jgi:hypothetical protein
MMFDLTVCRSAMDDLLARKPARKTLEPDKVS